MKKSDIPIRSNQQMTDEVFSILKANYGDRVIKVNSPEGKHEGQNFMCMTQACFKYPENLNMIHRGHEDTTRILFLGAAEVICTTSDGRIPDEIIYEVEGHTDPRTLEYNPNGTSKVTTSVIIRYATIQIPKKD